jgi:hypothetical protein
MYVRTPVVLVVLTLVGVSFVANAQQPAGDPAPVVAPAAEALPAPAVAPDNSQAPATDSPAVVDVVPAPSAPPSTPAPIAATPSSATTVAAKLEVEDRKPLAFRGSNITYSHSISALTLAPGAEPYYNPTYGHRLGLLPEWHFNDQLFIRGRLYLSQEFTTSDTTARNDHEVELSDLWTDVGLTGYTEPKTGLHVATDVRFLLPTSKASQSQSRIVTVGPSLTLSRDFKILSGLSIAYTGRFTYRFNRFTTGSNAGPQIINTDASLCSATVTNSPGAPLESVSAGCNRNNAANIVNYDFVHGPNITFNPLEKLSFNAFFSWYHLFLYPQGSTPVELQGAQGIAAEGTRIRNASVFALSVSYQLFKPVSLTFGSFTLSGQPSKTTGQYVIPLFNRDTSLYLDATFDIEAAVSSFL